MLTVEDGSIVAGADSYVDLTFYRAYAAKRGLTVPVADAECEVQLIGAMDWLAAQSQRWKGERMRGAADGPDWPRYGVVVNGYELPSDQIPTDIKNAQCQLGIDSQSIDLQPSLDAAAQVGPVTEETVDVLTVKYAEPSLQRTTSVFTKVDGFLSKFYHSSGNQVRLIRG